jgi:hypothetical protein
MHPLAEDFSKLKDAEIESRIQDLSKKYWQSHNPAIQQQITLFLDIYQEELRSRRAKLWQQEFQKRDKGLDELIKVN